MARIKVCPKCSTRNPASSSTCSNCEESLFNIKAMDEKKYEQLLLEEQQQAKEQEQKASEKNQADNANINANTESVQSESATEKSSDTENNQATTSGKLVKICPQCSHENPPMAKTCVSCNANIKHAQRICKQNAPNDSIVQEECQSRNNADGIICTFTSPDNKYSFDMLESEPIITIGREHKMQEYFAIRKFVSREHARLEIIGSKVAIVDLGKPNGIYINNIRVASNDKAILKNGDKVSLGGGWPQNFEHDNTGCFIVNYTK